MQRHELLDVRIHPAAQIRDTPRAASLLDVGQVDVTEVAHSTHGSQCPQLFHQPAMHRRINDSFLQRHAYDRPLRQTVGQRLVAPDQHIRVQYFQRIPRISQRSHPVIVVRHNLQVLRILQIQRVAALAQKGSRLAPVLTREQKQNGKPTIKKATYLHLLIL